MKGARGKRISLGQVAKKVGLFFTITFGFVALLFARDYGRTAHSFNSSQDAGAAHADAPVSSGGGVGDGGTADASCGSGNGCGGCDGGCGSGGAGGGTGGG